MSADVIQFGKPAPAPTNRKSGKSKAPKQRDEREWDKFRLKIRKEILERARYEVLSAQERVRALTEDVRELERKISAKARTVVACSVDGEDFEVTFYDRQADDDIYKLHQQVRRGKAVTQRRCQNHLDTAFRARIIRAALTQLDSKTGEPPTIDSR
jgi:hypothetical protein